MQIQLNGTTHDVDAPPSTPLLWVLRDELGLTGTKYGCGVGICGACTIHLNGIAVRACVTPLAAAEGASLRTIEGLATVDAGGERTLHPVQQAFIDEQVPQCGWCMSGQIMAAAAYLERATGETGSASVDEAAIENALGNNYCRCGCYVRIRRAVAVAAEEMMNSER